MKVFRDEATGYLVIDEIEEGFEILPTSLYQSYLKKIKDLEEQNKDLQAELRRISTQKDTLSTQIETYKGMNKLIKATAESERSIGIAIGYTLTLHKKDESTGKSYPIDFELAKEYWHHFNKWYASAMDNGKIDMIDADYKRSIAMDNFRSKLSSKDKP